MFLSILCDVSRGAEAVNADAPYIKNNLQKTFPKDDDYGITASRRFSERKA